MRSFLALLAVAACNPIAGLDGLVFSDGDGGATGQGGGGGTGGGSGGGPPMCTDELQTDIDNCGEIGNVCNVRAHSVPDCIDCACVNDCDPGWHDCDDDVTNGCETATDADPLNCGGCNVDCGGALCEAGTCGAIALATGQGSPADIDVLDGTVFWINTTGGEVRSCAATGCNDAPTLLAETGGSAFYMSIDATHVYWNNNGAGKLYSCPHAGCPLGPLELYDGQSPTRNEVNSTHLFWHSNVGDIGRALKDGSGFEIIYPSAGDSGEIKVTETEAYWTSRSAGVLARCTIDDCVNSYTELATNYDTPRGLAIDATHAYFGETGSGPDALARVPLMGGTVETLDSNQSEVHMIRLTETMVYWTNEATGEVKKMPKDGGPIEVVMDGLSGPRSLALADGFVYVTDTDGGRIMRGPW